jgi:hypothetical protein
LYGMYLTMKSFLSKDFDQRLVDLKAKHMDIVLPIRLQAYERVAIFLERISPKHLIPRVNDSNYNVAMFHEVLLAEIKQEYNYNLSQQVYISDKAWNAVMEAVDQLVSAVNDAALEVDKEAPSIELAKKIIEHVIQNGNDFTSIPLLILKDEVRTYFG